MLQNALDKLNKVSLENNDINYLLEYMKSNIYDLLDQDNNNNIYEFLSKNHPDFLLYLKEEKQDFYDYIVNVLKESNQVIFFDKQLESEDILSFYLSWIYSYLSFLKSIFSSIKNINDDEIPYIISTYLDTSGYDFDKNSKLKDINKLSDNLIALKIEYLSKNNILLPKGKRKYISYIKKVKNIVSKLEESGYHGSVQKDIFLLLPYFLSLRNNPLVNFDNIFEEKYIDTKLEKIELKSIFSGLLKELSDGSNILSNALSLPKKDIEDSIFSKNPDSLFIIDKILSSSFPKSLSYDLFISYVIFNQFIAYSLILPDLIKNKENTYFILLNILGFFEAYKNKDYIDFRKIETKLTLFKLLEFLKSEDKYDLLESIFEKYSYDFELLKVFGLFASFILDNYKEDDYDRVIFILNQNKSFINKNLIGELELDNNFLIFLENSISLSRDFRLFIINNGLFNKIQIDKDNINLIYKLYNIYGEGKELDYILSLNDKNLFQKLSSLPSLDLKYIEKLSKGYGKDEISILFKIANIEDKINLIKKYLSCFDNFSGILNNLEKDFSKLSVYNYSSLSSNLYEKLDELEKVALLAKSIFDYSRFDKKKLIAFIKNISNIKSKKVKFINILTFTKNLIAYISNEDLDYLNYIILNNIKSISLDDIETIDYALSILNLAYITNGYLKNRKFNSLIDFSNYLKDLDNIEKVQELTGRVFPKDIFSEVLEFYNFHKADFYKLLFIANHSKLTSTTYIELIIDLNLLNSLYFLLKNFYLLGLDVSDKGEFLFNLLIEGYITEDIIKSIKEIIREGYIYDIDYFYSLFIDYVYNKIDLLTIKKLFIKDDDLFEKVTNTNKYKYVSKLAGFSWKKADSKLNKLGFKMIRGKGSHRIYKNEKTGAITIIPSHSEICPATLYKALKVGNIGIDEFLEI